MANLRIMFDERKWLVAVVAAVLSTGSALADTYTWTGAASAVWDTTAANWDKGAWVNGKGNVAVFPAGVTVTNITLGADVTVGDIKIYSGNWSLGGAHTLTIDKSGNACLSQTLSASLTLKDGITVSAVADFENNLNVLNIENATFSTPKGITFHNGWNGGKGLPGGATINVGEGGTLTVSEFVPSGSKAAGDAEIYRVNVTTGGVFAMRQLITTYSIDVTRYSTLYFDGGTFSGFPGENVYQFTRQSTTSIKIGPGGMHIGGDANIGIATQISAGGAADGGISIDTSRQVYLNNAATGLPENTFTGPVRLNGGGVYIVNSDRNLGAVPGSQTNGIVFGATSTLLSLGNAKTHENRNILINSNAVARIAAQGASLAVAGTISGDAPGSVRNGTLSTESAWAGDLSLLPPAGRTNSFGRLLVKNQSLTIGGAGVTELTDTLPNQQGVGDNGVLSVMGGATLNITNGLVCVMANAYTTVADGMLNVSDGGVLDLSRQVNFVNSLDGAATTTVSRAGKLIANGYVLSMRSTNRDGGLTRLESGGVLAVNNFWMNTANGVMQDKGQIDFDGGILAPLTATRSFFDRINTVSEADWNANTPCFVREGGAAISNNVEIWTHHPFLSGAENDGGLHKWGTGNLAVITTGNTFNGPVEVHQGQLVWGNNNNYPSNGRLVTHAGATANINTVAQTFARVEGDGSVINCNSLTVSQAVAPGFGAAVPGTLAFRDRCVFANGCLFEIDPGDKLTVCNGQDISDLSLHVNDVSELDRETTYTILDVASGGDFVGQFKDDNVHGGSNWRIKYDHSNRKVLLKFHRGFVITFR